MATNQNNNILFLSTYPPRACGIATFTQDLVGELKKTGKINPEIVAVNDSDYQYPPEVRFTIDQQTPDSYYEAAEKINSSGACALMVEHEYGIYGGEWGEYVLNLTNNLKIPYFTTLHTVLPNPDDKQRENLSALIAKSQKVVTMAANTVGTLKNVYGADPEKIAVIHHGVPEFPVKERDALKNESGCAGRFVISTFGLLSPGKGLEYGVEAIAQVAKRHPEVLYLILGKTHPVIKRRNGEKYRESLENAVKNLGIENNVRFVNRYLEKEEIVKYLQLSDVYMTPYLSKDQAVSGTLAYAVGYGRVIISTPYIYACEMLAHGRGLLAEFHSAASIAEKINYVIENPEKKAEMEKKTLELGKTMMWREVAQNYLALFKSAAAQTNKKGMHI